MHTINILFTRTTILRTFQLNPFTAKDAIWRPGGITQLNITLWTRYDFHRAFQQPVRLL